MLKPNTSCLNVAENGALMRINLNMQLHYNFFDSADCLVAKTLHDNGSLKMYNI